MKKDGFDRKKQLLSEIKKEKEWVCLKYGEERLYNLLDLWLSKSHKACREQGVKLTDDEILNYFHTSYFRYLSNFQNNRQRLDSKINLMINRIQKEKLLKKLSSCMSRDPLRWRQYKLDKIQKRLDTWEKSIRKTIPGISEDEIFSFFRIRYLGVDDRHFETVEIPKGVRNMKNFIRKKKLLKRLSISPAHPQFDEWMLLAFWEFKRRITPLFGALNRFMSQTLDFPSTSKSFTKKEFSKFARDCGVNGRLAVLQDEMLFKLILYFKGLSLKQIMQFSGNLKDEEKWLDFDYRSSIRNLLGMGLIEEKAPQNGTPFLIPAGEEVLKEHVLEKWILDLRKDMNVGTGEALSYLSPRYKDHSLEILKQTDIPKATQKLMDERKKLLEMLYIYPADPRFNRILKMSLTEIQKRIQRISTIVDAYRQNELTIDPEWEEDIDYFAEEELSEKDVKVFKLIAQLKSTSFKQLAEIHKKMNKGKIGFSLKWSIQKLCKLGLVSEPKTNLYRIQTMN